MTINNRITELRKALGLSQNEFGDRLCVTRGVVTNMELGRAPIKPLMIKLICRTFNVNPLWLESGVGEMFLDVPDTILDDLSVEFDLSPTELAIVTNYLRMSPDDRRKVIELIKKLSGE